MVVKINKSAQKAARAAGRRQQRNKSVRSQVKTGITKAEKLLFAGELEAGRAAVAEAMAALDKAAEKGIIHGNNVARRKSRLMKKLNTAAAAPAKETPEKAA